jgi:demethylmenaquinone methyltransferase/2-methoxy-6-polyprenyl-1,4-benzoquinol methylase
MSAERPVVAEQIAYYRERAGEYDQWWFRTGRYDRGAEFNAAWFADVAIVEAAVCATLERVKPRTTLEVACGTGLFTRLVAPRVETLTAVDASPEVIALNRARVASDNVRYVEADLFEWTPDRRFDCVLMSFWLSHVPHERFDPFWAMVRNALAPDGIACVVDSALDPTSTARDHSVPDGQSGLVTRKLNDGRQFRIVKIFRESDELNRRLAVLGFDARILRTPRYFIYGDARVAALRADTTARAPAQAARCPAGTRARS